MIKKASFKHIESELYGYKETLKEINKIEKDIIHCKISVDENSGGGRSSYISKPTENIGIALAVDKKLTRLKEIAEAIELVYKNAPETHKELIELKYWTKPQKYTWDGLADKLHISKRQAMRWRDEVVYAIAEVIGWR